MGETLVKNGRQGKGRLTLKFKATDGGKAESKTPADSRGPLNISSTGWRFFIAVRREPLASGVDRKVARRHVWCEITLRFKDREGPNDGLLQRKPRISITKREGYEMITKIDHDGVIEQQTLLPIVPYETAYLLIIIIHIIVHH
jgi:hypothetical protein